MPKTIAVAVRSSSLRDRGANLAARRAPHYALRTREWDRDRLIGVRDRLVNLEGCGESPQEAGHLPKGKFLHFE